MARENDAKRRPTTRRTALIALVALGLGLVVYASAQPSLWIWNPPRWNLGEAPLPTPTESAPTQSPDTAVPPPQQPTPHVLTWIATGLGIVLALVVLFFLGRWLYRAVRELLATSLQRPPPVDRLDPGIGAPGVPLTQQQVTDAVAQALQRLDAARTPGDAVIVAWLALEEAADRNGMGRNPAQTPTEFTTDLLDRSAVPVVDTMRLRALYLRARFSDLPTSVDDVGQARAALAHIARELERKVPEREVPTGTRALDKSPGARP